jgi:hypothetical protein
MDSPTSGEEEAEQGRDGPPPQLQLHLEEGEEEGGGVVYVRSSDASSDGRTTHANPLEAEEGGAGSTVPTAYDTKRAEMQEAQQTLAENLDVEDYYTPVLQIDHDQEALSLMQRQKEFRALRADSYLEEHGITHPNSGFRKKWDLTQVLFLAYVAVSVPYRIGFEHDTQPFQFWFIVDVIVDVYFVYDIKMSFTTAYVDDHNEFQFELGVIRRNYLRTWFIIDVLGCLPINYVLLFMGAQSAEGGRANKFFRFLRASVFLTTSHLPHLVNAPQVHGAFCDPPDGWSTRTCEGIQWADGSTCSQG